MRRTPCFPGVTLEIPLFYIQVQELCATIPLATSPKDQFLIEDEILKNSNDFTIFPYHHAQHLTASA